MNLPAGPVATLVSLLLAPERRQEAARNLAHYLEADELFLFVMDREVGALLPGPGFPRTLPAGRTWRAFLEQTMRAGRFLGELPFPVAEVCHPAEGLALADGSVLVLLGGDVAARNLEPVEPFLPFVTTSLRLELDREVAEAKALAARQAASEARMLAEALDRSRADLRHALSEARQARDLLAQELATRDAFLSAIAHDLKNPLAAIRGISQILGRRIRRLNLQGMDWMIEGLSTLDTAATRMTAQIDQLLDLTRLRMGHPLELDLEMTDLVVLVRRVVEAVQKTTERHHLEVDLPDRLIGEWDAVRLDRVIGNLLANAVKYSPEGGTIRISVRREEGEGSDWAILEVQDHGVGIPPADLPRIFDRFHRGGNVSGQVEGSGIGLASARQIVEQHGGTIAVQSTLGEGATFTVRLPRISAPATAPAPPAG